MRNFSQITEKLGDTAIFTFGRFNPPTTGHEKLIDALAREQSKNAGSKMYVFSSQSQNPKKDPLPFALKVAYMRKMFPKYAKNIMANKKIKMVFDIAVELHNKGHRAIVMVVGSDRVTEFEGLLNKYNGVNGRHGYYGFDNIEVVSAGERDPDAEGVSGMSASKMRAAASAGDFDTFKTGVPSGFRDALKLYNDVRKNMGIREEKDMGEMTDFESLRDLYLTGKLWNIGDIVESKGIKGKVINKGTNYLSFVDENNKVHKTWLYDIVERDYKKEYANYQGTPEQIARRSSRNKARRVMGDNAVKGMDVGHIDNNPMNNDPSNLKNEEPSDNRREPRLRERDTKQDKDVKDREGTQPAKYYAKDTEGDAMSKSTKQARARHFEKGKKGPAPGDKSATTKPSKHTKKFKQMYGEKDIKIPLELLKLYNKGMRAPAGSPKHKEIMKQIDDMRKKLGIKEKLGKNADVGDYVDDFRKSDAPQFKGKSDKKIKDMAVAAYLDKKDKNEEVDMEIYHLDEKITALVNKAKKTGMPYSILKKVYDRGMAAYKTGHRPGATPQQWALARVNSFTTKSSGTWGKADKDLADKVRASEEVEIEEKKTVTKTFGVEFQIDAPDEKPIRTGKEPHVKTIDKLVKKHKLRDYHADDLSKFNVKDDVGGKDIQKFFKDLTKSGYNVIKKKVTDNYTSTDLDFSEKELGMIPKKKTKGHEVLGPESVNEWFESNQTRAIYQLRYEDDWWWKLNEVHDQMLEKIGACCDDCLEEETIQEQPEHEITVGNYTTKFFYMCGSAQKVMSANKDKPNIEPLVRLQDDFYKLEKEVMDAGEATDEQKVKAKELYNKIMSTAGELGLADDVDDYMKQHIDSIEKGDPKPGFGRTDIDESLWANIHKKRQRIKRGSGEKMRKKGAKGAPSAAQMKRAKGEEMLNYIEGVLKKDKKLKNLKVPKKGKAGVSKFQRMKTLTSPTDSPYRMMMRNAWGEMTEKDDKSGKELNNPTRGDVKKYKVYVKNDKGNVVKVEFGDPNMEIKRDDPERRKSFRARHNCDNPGPKYKARYWSCKFWSAKSVTDLMKG